MALVVRHHIVGRISLAEHGTHHLVNAPGNAILRLVELKKNKDFVRNKIKKKTKIKLKIKKRENCTKLCILVDTDGAHRDALGRVGEQGAQPAWYQAHMEQRDQPVEQMEEGMEKEQTGLNFAHAKSPKSRNDSPNESDLGVQNDVMVYYHHPQTYEKNNIFEDHIYEKITIRKEYSFI